jgi:hypothetical protein
MLNREVVMSKYLVGFFLKKAGDKINDGIQDRIVRGLLSNDEMHRIIFIG